MELQNSKNSPLSSAPPIGGTGGGHPFALKNVDRVPEINDEPSLTIPDMTMSAKELYNRYRLGTLPADFVRSVLYDESDDFDSVVAEYLPEFDLVDVDRELSKLRDKFNVMHGISNASAKSDANAVSLPNDGSVPKSDDVGGALSDSSTNEVAE